LLTKWTCNSENPTGLDFNEGGTLQNETRGGGMSDPPPAAAPDEGVAFFQVDCPTCGWDSDAPDTSYLAGPVAPIRDTAFLLCQLKCEGCGTGFDRAFWPIEAAGLAGFPEIDEPGPEAAGLLARYEALEAGYRQEWEALYAVISGEPFGTRGIDLAGCPVAPRLDRPTAVVPRLLALRALLAQRSSFLLGPRQTGKIALVRRTLGAARVYDLLDTDESHGIVRIRFRRVEESGPMPRAAAVG
jgi:hypothetical protein